MTPVSPTSLQHKLPPHPRGVAHNVAAQTRLVAESPFRNTWDYRNPMPDFVRARERHLPVPRWDARPEVIDCYWDTWSLAWRNIRQPNCENGFLVPYLTTAFNGAVFMWDSAFIVQFADFGRKAMPFIRTLDVFYCKQDEDGFISREISETTGKGRWAPLDPRGTGPNVLAWSEWLHYQRTGDRKRIENIFPALLAYHRWTRLHRTWPNGAYWSCNLATGMDNQPRYDGEPALQYGHHSFMTWIDATAHGLLSAETLVAMAECIGREEDIGDLREEINILIPLVNQTLWNEDLGFYVDGFRDGSLHDLMTIGAYWLLLTGGVPSERLERFLAPLEDEKHFKRPHRVPGISAGHPAYDSSGDYWCGGVWCPTNYMVLRGLHKHDRADLAHEIGLNHLENVVTTWRKTESIWESYAPEAAEPCRPSNADLVGWSGIAPVAVLFEEVFGLRADAPNRRLVVDVRLTDAYGVDRFPFMDNLIDLSVAARPSPRAKPQVTVKSANPIEIDLRWVGGRELLHLSGE